MRIDLVKLAAGAPPQATASGESPLRTLVVEALKTVHDPEIPVDIYELGLIYRLDIDEAGRVAIDMTLTAPNCPVADAIPRQVADAVQAVEGVTSAEVELVWDPPWDMSRMSETARLALDMY